MLTVLLHIVNCWCPCVLCFLFCSWSQDKETVKTATVKVSVKRRSLPSGAAPETDWQMWVHQQTVAVFNSPVEAVLASVKFYHLLQPFLTTQSWINHFLTVQSLVWGHHFTISLLIWFTKSTQDPHHWNPIYKLSIQQHFVLLHLKRLPPHCESLMSKQWWRSCRLAGKKERSDCQCLCPPETLFPDPCSRSLICVENPR